MVSLLAVLLPQLAQAQAWPQRPVRVVVPYAPGGSTDVQARMISERLTAAFGQQFVVDNRPGASSRSPRVRPPKARPVPRRRGWARKARRLRRTYVERRFNTMSKSSSTPST